MILKELNFDYYSEKDWAYQYRNCNQNTKRMLKDFLNRVVKPEILKRIKHDALSKDVVVEEKNE